MNVTLKGFDGLSAKLKGLSSGATERMMPVCKQLAEDITETAKGLVYQDGLQYQDGAIRDSLHGYAQQEDGEIKFGVKTDLDIANYHEMGTGPVGTGERYPHLPALHRMDILVRSDCCPACGRGRGGRGAERLCLHRGRPAQSVYV